MIYLKILQQLVQFEQTKSFKNKYSHCLFKGIYDIEIIYLYTSGVFISIN